jgi:membrane protein implicated in regulation of membrane protease activity
MLLVAAILLALFVLPSPWGLVAVIVGLALEAGETLFWIRLSKRGRPFVGAETLIGATASVAAPCRPHGQVRVQGELWQARCDGGADIGETVRIKAVDMDGLTLLVERL